MYKKKQHNGAHKVPYSKQRKQGVDNHTTPDIRYTPTPVQDHHHPGTKGPRSRVESENRNWMLQEKESVVERHSPDSALTASSNGSNPSFQHGIWTATGFRRSQSIPNLFDPTPPSFHMEQSRRMIPPGTHRANSLSRSGPYQHEGPTSVHQGPFVRVRVEDYEDGDAGGRVMESSSLVRNRFQSEPNLFDPESNERARRIEKRQPFSVRTVEMRKSLGMFGFVLSCKYVLNDPLVPRELRSYPRIDTVSVEGVAHRTGLRHGHYVLEMNDQSVELSSLNRCTSLLEQSGDTLRLKIASDHRTNEPLDFQQQQSKGSVGSYFTRDIPTSHDSQRHRVRYRESALKRHLNAAAHQTHTMTRSNSTPNLADDDQSHIYEELAEPLPDVQPSAPATSQKTNPGRRGSEESKSGKRASIRAPPKQTGKLENTHGHPTRRPDDIQGHKGRSDREASNKNPRKGSVDLPGGSGGFPPSPPPRPASDWGVAIQKRSQVDRESTPTVLNRSGMRSERMDSDAKPALVEMKIRPGVGIASIASVSRISSTSSETPVKFEPFTDHFNDEANNIVVTPPSRLAYDSGRTGGDSGGRGMSVNVSQINIVAMQAAETVRGRATPMPQYQGDNTRRTVADSGNKEMIGSRNNVPGVTLTENGRALHSSTNKNLTADMESPANKVASGSKVFGDQGWKSELKSPGNLLNRQGPVMPREDEPTGLLAAIMQHPLMRNDRPTSNELDRKNPTVTSPFHETKHGPQKVAPPKPPPPKPKANTDAVLEGTLNRGVTPGRKTSLTEELDSHNTGVKNLRLLKSANKTSDFKVQAERGTAKERIERAGKRPTASPQTQQPHQQTRDLTMNALVKPGSKPQTNQNINPNRISPGDFRHPKQNLRPEHHPAQVLRLDGATADQSYSDDIPMNRGKHKAQQPAHQESSVPEPVFSFDVSTGRLLLLDATVDQSSTESDLLPLPPPPPVVDFTASDSKLSEIRSQDDVGSSWNRRSGSTSCITSPFNGRSISLDTDAVFLEGIVSPPPPPVFFIDPEENSGVKSNHDSGSNSLDIPTFRGPRLHPKAIEGTFPIRFGPGMNSLEFHSKSEKDSAEKRFGHETKLPDFHIKVDQETFGKRFGRETNAPNLHSKADQDTFPKGSVPTKNPTQAAIPTNTPLPPPEFQSISDAVPRISRHPPEPPSKNQWGRPNAAPKEPVLPSEAAVSHWSSADVANWLREIGLGQHAEAFTSHRVDGQRLSAMTRRELIDLGVTDMTQRRDIERGVIRLNSLMNT